MLQHFSRTICGYDLPDYDGSRIEREQRAMSESSPIVEALREYVGRAAPNGEPIVWVDGDDVCVRPIELVRHVGRETDLTLPGGSRAVRSWLTERYGAVEERGTFGRHVRLPGAAAEITGP